MVIQAKLCPQEEKTQSGQKREPVCCLDWGNATLPHAKEGIRETENGKKIISSEKDGAAQDKLMEQAWCDARRKENRLFIRAPEELYDGGERTVYHSFCNLMELLFQTGAAETGKTGPKPLLARLKKRKKGRQYQLCGEAMGPTQEFGAPVFITEEESGASDAFFISMGTLVTADGNGLPFEISVEASDSFVAYAGFFIDYRAVTAVEPLVLYLQENPERAEAQRFLLDLDAASGEDGTAALFSEMPEETVLMSFAPKEKNWLDEKREGFGSLRIWTKGEKKGSRLAAVGVQDVGFVYLPEKK